MKEKKKLGEPFQFIWNVWGFMYIQSSSSLMLVMMRRALFASTHESMAATIMAIERGEA
jgi:hypothetical protein